MKPRFSIWITSIGIALVLFIIMSIFKSCSAPKTDVFFEVNAVHEQSILKQGISNKSIKKLTLKPTNDMVSNTHIYIKEHSLIDSDIIENYNKYPSFYYSPIVMFFHGVSYSDSGFKTINPEQNTNHRRVEYDLRAVLDAILEDKTWEDIGINPTNIEGKVSLVLPTKNNSYYPYVEAMIYYALNDYNELTENDVIRLSPSVKQIISKCEYKENITHYITDSYRNGNKNSKVVLGPEFLIIQAREAFDCNFNGHWQGIYSPSSIAIVYDLYLTNDDNILDVGKQNLIFELLSNDKIFTGTGFRPTNNTSTGVAMFHKIIPTISTYAIDISQFDKWIDNINKGE